MKKIVHLCLALILCLGLAAPACAVRQTFSDVSADNWAYSYIERAYREGVMTGTYYNALTGERRFTPNGELTMAEFAVILARAFYADEMRASAATGTWYSQAVDAVQKHGIFNGLDSSAVLTVRNRYQLAVMIYNLLEDQGVQMPAASRLTAVWSRIADWSSIPSRYRMAVSTVYYFGIMNGIGNGSFSGTLSMTRNQAVTVYCRLAQFIDQLGQERPAPTPETSRKPGAETEGTLANGAAITDENIREILYGLQSSYPEGMRWTNANFYQSRALNRGGYGCEGFALICSDAVFGTAPISSTHSDFDKVRVGDMLRVNNDTHTVVVLEKRANSVVVTEGNYNSSIHWGREISRQSLESGNFSVRTRYPS